jgi:addiction module RelE/StbE family toxin
MELIWTKTAEKDIDNIFKYISYHSIFYASNEVNRIIDATQILFKFPHAGKIVAEINNKNIREIIVSKYRVVYTIISDDEIHILTVHHGAKLFSTDLFD